MENNYKKRHNRYHLEQALLTTMDKQFLQELINEKKEESQNLRNNLKVKMQKLMLKPYYEFLPETSRYLLQRIIFEYEGGPELMQMESTIENWKYMIQLKYENKRNKDSLTKGDIMKVKEIPIEILVEKFIGAKIPKNQIIECLFHKDSTGSLKIYPETNSFYCFGCQKGGTTIEFTANFLEISNKEAITKLKQYLIY